MPGRLAVDFGTSNTVITVWDAVQKDVRSVYIPDLSRVIPYQDQQSAYSIPSLIHYGANDQRWLGQQVIDRRLYHSARTFRWAKRYIASRNNAKIQIDGRGISFFEAGKAFLSSILVFAASEIRLADEEVAFTAPVEAFEHYEDWLTEVAEKAGIHRFRLIDESSAAALGYQAHILPGDAYLVFDFGGGTLDVSIVLIEEDDLKTSGCRCRVLGKSGGDLGGATIDQWLMEEVLRRNKLKDSDSRVRPISRPLLVECERVKEQLTFQDKVPLSLSDKERGIAFSEMFTRNDFELLLEKRGFGTTIDRIIRRALRGAWEKGYTEDDLKAILMVGGSSLMPAVLHTVQRFFGKERVMLSRPIDAVARGAAAFVAGSDFFDYIQHDYAVRYIEPAKKGYQYHTIVKKGTPYPTSEPAARLTIRATHDGQKQLGLAIFEVGDLTADADKVELVFDPSGAARIVEISPDRHEQRTHFWMNEKSPTFLNADPPAGKGERRFEVDFAIDGNKRLLLTARNIQTGETVMQNYPVVKLS